MESSWSGANEGRQKKSESQTHEDLADFYLKTGEIPIAIEYLTGLLRGQDSSPRSKSEKASILRRLAVCYSKLGKCDHALELLDKAFALVADGDDRIELANVICERGWVHFKRGEYDLSQADLECSLDIYLSNGLGSAIASTYNRLGGVYFRRGELGKAVELYRAALVPARMAGDRQLVGVISNNLGLVYKNLGRWTEARRFFVDALLVASELGQQIEKGIRLNNIGIVFAKMGDWKKAFRCWSKALKVLSAVGNRWDCIPVLIALGRYHLVYREFEAAESYFAKAVKESADGGDARSAALSFEAMGDLHLAKDRLDLAERCYREAMDIAMEIAPNGDIVGEVARRLCELEIKKGNLDVAMEHANRAISAANSIHDIFELGCATRAKACVEALLGEFERARASFNRAIDIFSKIQSKIELALTYLAASESLAQARDWSRRLRNGLQEAAEIFDEAGMNYESIRARVILSQVSLDLGNIKQCKQLIEEAKKRSLGDLPDWLKERVKHIETRIDQAEIKSDERMQDLGITERIGQAKDPCVKIKLLVESCLKRSGATIGAFGLIEKGVWKTVHAINLSESQEALIIDVIQGLGVEGVSGVVYNGNIANIVSSDYADTAANCLLIYSFKVDESLTGCLCLLSGEAIGRFSDEAVWFVSAVAEVAGAVLTKGEQIRKQGQEVSLQSQRSPSREWLITRNKKMAEILDTLNLLARTQATVLIEGETGTGKEMIARAIHELSDRSGKPFVTIDCSALSEDLLESELFGHVAGAFTDAKKRKKGLFEEAQGGTVFLDEIDKTSKKFQYRLLQVVDKHEFKMVGATDWQKADFRLICATNRDLAQETKSGKFLEDLYYRLKVISLRIPPLRDRREDIPLLAEHFMTDFTSRLNKRIKGISPEAIELLMEYDWPGNVRQLKHEIERAVTFCEEDGLILPRHFSEELVNSGQARRSSSLRPITAVIEDVEKELIKEAIKRFNGNKSKAARSLGLSRRGLLNKINRYRIEL